MSGRFYKFLFTCIALSSSVYAFQKETVKTQVKPEGEKYNSSVFNHVAPFSHQEAVSAFVAASSHPIQAGEDQGIVCIQKTSKGFFRSHSTSPGARGIVTSEMDLNALRPLFKLTKKKRFVLSVPAQEDGKGEYLNYIGQIILISGDGSANGDVVCYARYHSHNTPASR